MMMIPQMLGTKLSRTSFTACSRLGAPSMAFCMLVAAAACTGSIDDHQDVSSGGATSSTTNPGNATGARNATGAGVSTGTANEGNDTALDGINAAEQDSDDVQGIRGGSSSTGGRRGGGTGRRNPVVPSDAGAVDAGAADAGDAGVIDADAGPDAGRPGDAGAAL